MKETKYPTALKDAIWTYQDYMELPDDQKRYQIIGGVLYMVPSPTSNHQNISRNFEFILWSYVRKNDLGKVFYAPTDVVLDTTNVVVPDILFISKDRLEIIEEKGIMGAPDLIVEIISPSTRKMDETFKKDLYEHHGVYEYLLIYPKEKKVVQYVMEGGSYQRMGSFVLSDHLPLKSVSMTINLREVFED